MFFPITFRLELMISAAFKNYVKDELIGNFKIKNTKGNKKTENDLKKLHKIQT